MVDDELKRNSLQSKELERKIAVIKEAINDYMNEINVIEFNQKVEFDLQGLRLVQKQKQELSVGLQIANTNLLNGNQNFTKQLDEKREFLLNIEKDDFTNSVYKFFIDAFGRGGFPKHIIQTLLPDIEKDVQEILTEVGFDFNFSIESDDETVKFYLERDGIKNEVKKYSGFEKWLPCLALHKAIMPSCLVPYSNVITFDEIFSAPSEKNLPSCYKMMEKMNEVYENVMIISHNSDIRVFADNVINLVKVDNITEIVN
jgi:DNA repair exonuclease SbcCD ATPase subunit